MDNPREPAADQSNVGWRFDNTYSRLPGILFDVASPATMPEPRVVVLNHPLAAELGLDLHNLSPEAAAALFAGQTVTDDMRPIAQAYAGHQYGHFTMLGDGRAILLGEHRTPSGRLVDIQLKGAGRTRFSRGGDGLAALGPMLREYMISEAMHALGIPTTRSLAVVTTGAPVYRTTAQRGAILTRVASSHIRVGTFEYLAARRDESHLRALADYAIERHDPELAHEPDRYVEFLRAVIKRQAALIAQWQGVGFIHGVMNTDNMAVSGETIDYGPCAFMNAYSPATVYSSIDRNGRYAYGNQPAIAHWNLARLAESLLPLLDSEQERAIAIANDLLAEFPVRFDESWLVNMRKKLGLEGVDAGDPPLIQALLDWMERSRADFTNTFRDLSSAGYPAGAQYQDAEFRDWHARWQSRLGEERRNSDAVYAGMRQVNPYLIPRNHQVEAALAAAEQSDDLSVMQQLVAALQSPFETRPDLAQYREPSPDDDSYRTFCGT